MIHQMRLNPIPYEQILNREKTYEIRLNDEKRQIVKVGDTIIFAKRPECKKTMSVLVCEVLKFKSIADMAKKIPNKLIGFETGSRVQDIENCYYAYYTKEEEQKYGVVAFKIKVKN